jgi:hypothetical protein
MTADNLKFEVSDDIKSLIPEKKLISLIQAFTQLDSNQDGKIGIDEFLEFSLKKEKTQLTNTFKTLDNNQDGFIEFEEFVVATEPTFRILQRFRELDLDRNGLLSVDEAIEIATQLVLPISAPQVQTLISEVDRDGDGQITYFEYLGVITHIGFQ